MSVTKDHPFLWTCALVLFDAGCLLGAYTASALLTTPPDESTIDWLLGHVPHYVALVSLWFLVAIDQRLFVSRRSDTLMPELFSVAKAVFISLFLSIFVLALLLQDGLDREFVFVYCGVVMFTMVLLRTVVRLSLWSLRQRGYNYRRILIVGSNERAAHVVAVLQSHERFGFQIDGFLESDSGRHAILERLGVACLGEIENLEHVLVDRVIDVVYIALPVRSHYETIRSIAHLCEGVGVSVRLMADIFPSGIAGTELQRMGSVPLLSLSPARETNPHFAVQRIADTLISSILLIILMPVFLVIALLIKLESKGPVFVSRKCVMPGRRDSIDLVMFRTAASVSSSAKALEKSGSPTSIDENGITRVGKYLRRYSLDELPQMMNIWRGQISLMDPQAYLESGNVVDNDELSAVE